MNGEITEVGNERRVVALLRIPDVVVNTPTRAPAAIRAGESENVFRVINHRNALPGRALRNRHFHSTQKIQKNRLKTGSPRQ